MLYVYLTHIFVCNNATSDGTDRQGTEEGSDEADRRHSIGGHATNQTPTKKMK